MAANRLQPSSGGMTVNAGPDDHQSSPRFWGSRYSIGLVVFGAVASYFLLTEHRAHVVGALPFLLLLACPLMHVFMHRGHSHCHDPVGLAAGTGRGYPHQPTHDDPA